MYNVHTKNPNMTRTCTGLARHHVTPGDEYDAQWPFLRPYTARTIVTLLNIMRPPAGWPMPKSNGKTVTVTWLSQLYRV